MKPLTLFTVLLGFALQGGPTDYVGTAQAYADFMIEHGRDTYGKKHTPLFVTGMNRQTGKMMVPPFAHVKRKPFMPGWERDRELRGSDRNGGQADSLDQVTLLKLMHRLSASTGDTRYAQEANKTASWWMANAQSSIGLYPWGTHTHWSVSGDGGGGTFEFNHVWPYWNLDRKAMHRYAMGLWNHYISDKNTGDFNRHAHSHKHGAGGGMEFPWPGSAMIATWAEAHLDKPDPEYVRAISTVLKRWESLRDDNGHLAPCSSYREWAWYLGYMIAANRLDDWADRIAAKEPELAEKMRDYGRKNDAAYLKVADGLLNVKGLGPVKSYLRATGGFNPERLDIIGGPWQDRKDYAGFAVMLHERMKRNDSPALQTRYRQAVLDTAEIYMSVNPEVQWAVWGVNVANAIELMLVAHDLTGNAAYLHRGDHFGRLAIQLFLDDKSPLPKLTSQDDYYEIESVTDPSGDVWMLVAIDLQERLAKLSPDLRTPQSAGADGAWKYQGLKAPAASVTIPYGEGKSLFLSRREGSFGADELPAEIIVSDVVNSMPTLAEAKRFNGAYRRRFSGKHREASTASYGGFKDVLDAAELTLSNPGPQPATITVTATFHDSWDDRESREYTATLGPGEQKTLSCAAPAQRFIRRFDLSSTTLDLRLDQLAFTMTPRSKLNPLSAVATPPITPPQPVTPSAFDTIAPKKIKDGLVLEYDGKGPRSIPDSDALDLQAWTIVALVRATGGPGVVIGKTDGRNQMMNYRLQVDRDGKVAAVVRGPSAKHQVNRQANVDVRNRFAVIAARFDPKAKGVDKVSIHVDGRPCSYSYQNAQGELSQLSHDAPLLIGRQPGREPRPFQGDIAGILLYNHALPDNDMHATSHWLHDQSVDDEAHHAKSAEALVFLIAGQSNAGGVAAFSPEANVKSGMAKKHPTLPGSTAKEVGIPTDAAAYPRSHIWGRGFELLSPGKNLKGGYNDPNRHGIELPMAMLLQKQPLKADIFFVKHGPPGHNLHTQWKAGVGPDYKTFMAQFTPAMADLKKRYKKVRVIGLYWDQGESDVGQAAAYQRNLTTLFAALRKDIGIPDLQIYVRRLMFNDQYIPIAAAQTAVTTADTNAHLLDLDLGSNEENFKAWAWTDNNGHLSSKAYLELSKRITKYDNNSGPIKLLCVGDSITAAREGYVARLNALDGIATFNGGRSGHRAANATQRLTESLDAAAKAGFEPNKVTFFLGVNDLPARDKRPGPEKVKLCVDGVDAAIQTALKQFTPEQIILLAPCDVNPASMNTVVAGKGYAQAKELLPKLEAAYKALAKRHGVGFHSLLHVVSPEHFPDGLHPNQAGHAQIVKSLQDYFTR